MLKAIDILKNGVEIMDKATELNPTLITHFENEIKEYGLAIKELEELENRSCESCKYDNCGCDIQDILYNYYSNCDLSNFCCNKYEKRKIK